MAPGGLSPSLMLAPSREIFELIDPMLFVGVSPAGDDASVFSLTTSFNFSLAILSAIVDGLAVPVVAAFSELLDALTSADFPFEFESILFTPESPCSEEPAGTISGAFELFRFAMRSLTDMSAISAVIT